MNKETINKSEVMKDMPSNWLEIVGRMSDEAVRIVATSPAREYIK